MSTHSCRLDGSVANDVPLSTGAKIAPLESTARPSAPSASRRPPPPNRWRHGGGTLGVVAAVAAAATAAAVVASALVTHAAAHGNLIEPVARGLLGGSHFAPGARRFPGSPVDPKPHFPAGDKGAVAGSGKRSQKRATPSRRWTPFEPSQRGFVWRAGVCGDPIRHGQKGGGGGDHTRGGRYYGGGRVVQTYPRGGTLSMSMYVVEAHGGYVVLHVCDVSRCGGEISADCFRGGHCRRLFRERGGGGRNDGCGGARSGDCSPVDPAHPDRYVIPCPATMGGKRRVGGDHGGGRFRLPPDLTCEHCVVHWYWVSANSCNPPGHANYFRGPHAPSWTRSCTPHGQGGYKPAIGTCGKSQHDNDWPEEYYQCADIRINGGGGGGGGGGGSGGGGGGGGGETPPAPAPSTGLWLVADGQRHEELTSHHGVVTIGAGRYHRLTFLAVPPGGTHQGRVVFFIDGRRVWEEGSAPYYLYGNNGNNLHYWPPGEVIWGREFSLRVEVGGHRLEARVRLNR